MNAPLTREQFQRFLELCGGDAFPTGDEDNGGMTLFAYCAARAPEVIPEWFQHDYTVPHPVAPERPAGLSELAAERLRQWLRDGEFDLEVEPTDEYRDRYTDHDVAALARYAEQDRAHDAARDQWKRNREATRYFAWRIFYAENMVKFIRDAHANMRTAARGAQ